MYVEEGEHALKTSHYGTTYYFCSEACGDQFQAPEKAMRQLKLEVAAGVILTIPIILLTYLLPLTGVSGLILFFLSLPVQFVIGFRFYRGAFDSLRSHVGNMDLLIALGTSAAWIYSTVRALWHPMLLCDLSYPITNQRFLFQA